MIIGRKTSRSVGDGRGVTSSRQASSNILTIRDHFFCLFGTPFWQLKSNQTLLDAAPRYTTTEAIVHGPTQYQHQFSYRLNTLYPFFL